jgi:hypothetical protein
MGTAALNIAIEDMFETAWASTTPIRVDNVGFTPPTTSWVSVEVWDGKTDKASLGGGTQLRRSVGTVLVNIFTPLNGGSRPARLLSDQVSGIFRDVVVSGITFYEADIKRVGEKYFTNSGTGIPGTAQWYQMMVAVPFKYDEYV